MRVAELWRYPVKSMAAESPQRSTTCVDVRSDIAYLCRWLRGSSPSSGFTARSRRLPFSQEARIEAGYLLGRLQQGESLSLAHSRPLSRWEDMHREQCEKGSS